MKSIENSRDLKGSGDPGIRSDDKESTELSLFVRTSDEEIRKWDKARISTSLIRETTIGEDVAAIVARKVEKMISASTRCHHRAAEYAS